MAESYYYDKLSEWMNREGGDYRPYVRRKQRNGIADEFRRDPRFKNEVCNYLRTYAKGREKQSVSTIISGIANPDADIINILVGASLDACGYPDTGNSLIELAVAGLIGFGVISLLGALLSKK